MGVSVALRAGLKVYAIYKWLCRLKHPTLPSALHDSLSGGRGPEHGYMMMAIPDVRRENKPVKTLGARPRNITG